MCPVFVALLALLRLYISDPCRPAGRDRRSAPPDRRAPTQLTASSPPQAGRPTALDSVVALVARLAALGVHREARHSYSLASQGVRSLLDLEVAPSCWKTGSGCRDSRPDPTPEPSQRFVGSAPHSRRTAQASASFLGRQHDSSARYWQERRWRGQCVYTEIRRVVLP